MSSNTKKLTMVAMAVAMNFVGAWVALLLRLPIYFDSVGTIMSGILFGLKFGALAGLVTSLINGIFDSYSLYFMPVQIVLGILAGILPGLIHSTWKGKVLWTIVLSLPASIVGAFIVTYLFGTMSSSGSSYIVQFLRGLGVGDFVAVFVTQVCTDYFDKLLAVLLIDKILRHKIFQEL
ncbi:MAG: ECF transporter S component [Tissierellia bacterium]|nr:ECF transporter S component [Tissierellia bacterium]